MPTVAEDWSRNRPCRRTSRYRGKLFYRLVQQAANIDPDDVQLGKKPKPDSNSLDNKT